MGHTMNFRNSAHLVQTVLLIHETSSHPLQALILTSLHGRLSTSKSISFLFLNTGKSNFSLGSVVSSMCANKSILRLMSLPGMESKQHCHSFANFLDLKHPPSYVPYKYAMEKFTNVGSISKDHIDPSIFCVLTAKSKSPTVPLADFLIFSPRWDVASNTFRPPVGISLWFILTQLTTCLSVLPPKLCN